MLALPDRLSENGLVNASVKLSAWPLRVLVSSVDVGSNAVLRFASVSLDLGASPGVFQNC
jgi:hypothetical protein